jgi:hypothetical protein
VVAKFSAEHRGRGVRAPGNTSSEGRVQVSRVMVRWWNELGLAMLSSIGVATVVGGDKECSLQHQGVKAEENDGPKLNDTKWWWCSPERRKRRWRLDRLGLEVG